MHELNVRGEINRKVQERLERIAAEYEAGIVTAWEAKLQAEAVFDVISGMTTPETDEIMAMVTGEVGLSEPDRLTVLWNQDHRLFTLRRQVGTKVKFMGLPAMSVKPDYNEFRHYETLSEAAKAVAVNDKHCSEVGWEKL